MDRAGTARTVLLLVIVFLAACTKQSAADLTPDSTEKGHPGTSPTTRPTGPGPSATTRGNPEDAVLASGGPGAASGLEAKPSCSSAEPGRNIMQLQWMLASERGTAQRVDVTIFSEKFDDGRYQTSGTLPRDQSSLQWDRLAPGAVHFWRVLTLHRDGWVPSEVGRFTPGACIADYVSST